MIKKFFKSIFVTQVIEKQLLSNILQNSRNTQIALYAM